MYKFRLTIMSKAPRVFAFDAANASIHLIDGPKLELVARDADLLVDATAFHFEAGGYSTEDDARTDGERLRLRLRILNAMLNLGLHIAANDSRGASWAAAVKEKLLQERDEVLLDGVKGLAVFPDDGRHLEHVFSGRIDVKPSDPHYVLNAINKIWQVDVTLDPESEEALEILGLAVVEPSPKTAFIASFLALEPLVQRNRRSNASLQLIERFQAQIDRAVARKRHPLLPSEAQSLRGSISALKDESFSTALVRLSQMKGLPAQIQGKPIRKFVSLCIDARNKIAHRARVPDSGKLTELTAGLTHLVLTLIWTRTHLPSLSIDTPSSSLSVPEGGMKIRAL